VKKFNRVLLALLVVGIAITLLIVYQDIDHPYAFKFVIGFVIFLLLLPLYLTAAIFANMRKLRRNELRKRLVSFLIWFVFLSASSFLLDYLFRPSELDDWDWGIPLGLSMGITFYDLMFFGKKKP
jgi:amino acid transporter